MNRALFGSEMVALPIGGVGALLSVLVLSFLRGDCAFRIPEAVLVGFLLLSYGLLLHLQSLLKAVQGQAVSADCAEYALQTRLAQSSEAETAANVARRLVFQVRRGLGSMWSWTRLAVKRYRGLMPWIGIVFAVTVSATFFAPVVVRHEYLRAYDAPTHIFFSSSHLQDWWSLIEPRWYGGYPKASYPPLAHQLVALLAAVDGNLELSYEIVAWLFLSIVPLAVYQFARVFVDQRSALAACIMAVSLPSIRLMVFCWGQMPGFVSLVLLMFSMKAMSEYLETGNKCAAISTICLFTACVVSHHATALYLLPPTALVVVLTKLALGCGRRRTILTRFALAVVSSAMLSALAMPPYWQWLTNFRMQVPIPHPSRENILADPELARPYFFDLYGYVLILVPCIVPLALTKRYLLPLFIAFVFFMIMGLGGTTALPHFLLGSRWEWLTYERFQIWATVLALPLIGQAVLRIKSKATMYAFTFVLVLFGLSALAWLLDPQYQRMTLTPVSLSAIRDTFAQTPVCQERYLALGFGYQLPDLSTYSNARTLDGLWHSARTDPLLRDSGVGALGDAAYYGDDGWKTLDVFLSRKTPSAANCILINELTPHSQSYRDMVQQHGWILRTTSDGAISLWTRRGTPVKSQSVASPDRPGPLGVLWGVAPISVLVLAIGTQIVGRYRSARCR